MLPLAWLAVLELLAALEEAAEELELAGLPPLLDSVRLDELVRELLLSLDDEELECDDDELSSLSLPVSSIIPKAHLESRITNSR